VQFKTFDQDREYPGLSGSFKKKFRKLSKVAVHVGAAFLTGGASLSASAALLNAERQKKAQRAAAADTARQEQALMAQFNAPAVMPPSADGVSFATKSSPPPPQYAMLPAGESAPLPAELTGLNGRPSWMTPALIGGGVLLLVMMQRGGRR